MGFESPNISNESSQLDNEHKASEVYAEVNSSMHKIKEVTLSKDQKDDLRRQMQYLIEHELSE